MTNEPMIVSATQRLYIECIYDGQEVSPEFEQSTYETLSDLIYDIPDETTKIYVFDLSDDDGPLENITEKLAQAWLESVDDLVTYETTKPVYVDRSDAWREYAHDHRDRY